MNLQRREPVELTIEVTNKSNKDRLMSLELMSLEMKVGFDKSGLKTGVIKKLGEIKHGETRKIIFDVFPKHPEKGETNFELRLFEHHGNYSYIVNKWIKNFSLKIE